MDSISDRKLLADEVARLCYNHFDNLPKKGKPIEGKEWTVVAAFVQQIRQNDETKNSLEVVSMGTGSKCVGQNKLSKDGDILNDSHAEVIARRGFLRYMYHQMEIVASGKESDLFTVDPISKTFLQREGISFLFFSSHTPCGDASIIIKENSKIMSNTTEKLLNPTEIKVPSFDEEPPSKMPRFDIPDIHRTGAKCVEGGPQDLKQPGVNHHVAGVLRIKPGRGDRTLSMSCSDKLAKWNILGVQGSLLMNFLSKPIYVSHVIIGKCPYSQSVMERALITRFEHSVNQLGNAVFMQHKPDISQSQIEFKFGKVENDEDNQVQPCPSSISWCACPMKQLEVAVEGRKQGITKKNQNKPSCRLEICKKNLFQKFVSLLNCFSTDNLPVHLKEQHSDIQGVTYNEAKRLCSDYFEMWEQTRAKILSTWTSKPTTLTEFTVCE